jgi:hypothetical protein
MKDSSHHKITRFSDVLKGEGMIAEGYLLACESLEEPDVALAVKFLIKLDDLAARYGFSPREIIALLEPDHPEAQTVMAVGLATTE